MRDCAAIKFRRLRAACRLKAASAAAAMARAVVQSSKAPSIAAANQQARKKYNITNKVKNLQIVPGKGLLLHFMQYLATLLIF